MTGQRTGMFSTRKKFATNLTTTPAIFIIGILTSFCRGVQTTEAILRRSHGCTRSTWTGMASRITRMGTSLTGSRASLTTRVWRQPGQRSRIDFLLAPTRVIGREVLMRKIAARTTPSTRSGTTLPVLLGRSPLGRSTFVLGPFLHTTQMEDCPAKFT